MAKPEMHKFKAPRDCKVAAFGSQVFSLTKGENEIECSEDVAKEIQAGLKDIAASDKLHGNGKKETAPKKAETKDQGKAPEDKNNGAADENK